MFVTALLSAATLSASASAVSLKDGSILDQVVWTTNQNMKAVGQYQGLALYAAVSSSRPNVVMLLAANSLHSSAWKWCESSFSAGEVVKTFKPGKAEGDIDVTLARGGTERVVTINAANARPVSGLGTSRCTL